jgi:hypothetical protein
MFESLLCDTTLQYESMPCLALLALGTSQIRRSEANRSCMQACSPKFGDESERPWTRYSALVRRYQFRQVLSYDAWKIISRFLFHRRCQFSDMSSPHMLPYLQPHATKPALSSCRGSAAASNVPSPSLLTTFTSVAAVSTLVTLCPLDFIYATVLLL